MDDRAFLVEQIRERLRFYRSMTEIGLPRRETARPLAIGARALEAVRAELGACTRCRLHEGRRTIVFGAGSPDAELMLVGEGPGHEEDRRGLPFVGPAGELLTRILAAIDLRRDEVYIANVVKCRPPGNRDPEPDEIATCFPFLRKQIEAVRPKVILTLGRIATQVLLDTDRPMRALRGRVFELAGAKLVPTYHPAYLLRNPAAKRETWEDVQLVRRLLDEPR